MEFNIKKLFIFGLIFSSLYAFASSFFTVVSPIKDNANFNFINFTYLYNQSMGFMGGASSWIFHIFYATINLAFLPMIFAYPISVIAFIWDFFSNLINLIVYEYAIFNYPFSILPFGIGNLLTVIFDGIMLMTVITGIHIVSSGISSD